MNDSSRSHSNSSGQVGEQLPLPWDCGFMLGERDAAGDDALVLCEVNVSSVSPLPPPSIPYIVAAVMAL